MNFQIVCLMCKKTIYMDVSTIICKTITYSNSPLDRPPRGGLWWAALRCPPAAWSLEGLFARSPLLMLRDRLGGRGVCRYGVPAGVAAVRWWLPTTCLLLLVVGSLFMLFDRTTIVVMCLVQPFNTNIWKVSSSSRYYALCYLKFM